MNPSLKHPFNKNGLPNELKYKILDLLFAWQPGPSHPSELEAFHNTEIYTYALHKFHETNALMHPPNIPFWQTLPPKTLLRFKHLYIILNSENLAHAPSLLTNPLRENNNLHSIILDISDVSILPGVNYLKIKNAVFKLMSELVTASRGCVDEVSVLCGWEEGALERVVVGVVRRELGISPSLRINIVVRGGRRVRLCVWSEPFE